MKTWMGLPVKPSLNPHPLESIVREAFRDQPAHDGTTLACFLAGCSHFSGPCAASGFKAYRIVALDVLGAMESQRKLVRDESGWWREIGPKTNRPGRV